MAGEGLTEASYEGDSPWWMLVGFFIAMAIAKGIAYILKIADWPEMPKAVSIAGFVGLTLGGAAAAYDWAYLPTHNFTLFLINWSHNLVGFVVAAAVLTLLRKY